MNPETVAVPQGTPLEMPPPDRRPTPPPAAADPAALLGASARLFRPAALAHRLAGRRLGRPVRVPLARTAAVDLLLALLAAAAVAAAWLAAAPERLAALLRLARAALGGDGG